MELPCSFYIRNICIGDYGQPHDRQGIDEHKGPQIRKLYVEVSCILMLRYGSYFNTCSWWRLAVSVCVKQTSSCNSRLLTSSFNGDLWMIILMISTAIFVLSNWQSSGHKVGWTIMASKLRSYERRSESSAFFSKFTTGIALISCMTWLCSYYHLWHARIF